MREIMSRRHFLTTTGILVLVGQAASTVGPSPSLGAAV